MSFFSNNLVATVSQNNNPMFNARGTMSSQASAFKWNSNNRMLAPAFRADNKEQGAAHRSQDNMAEEMQNANN